MNLTSFLIDWRGIAEKAAPAKHKLQGKQQQQQQQQGNYCSIQRQTHTRTDKQISGSSGIDYHNYISFGFFYLFFF